MSPESRDTQARAYAALMVAKLAIETTGPQDDRVGGALETIYGAVCNLLDAVRVPDADARVPVVRVLRRVAREVSPMWDDAPGSPVEVAVSVVQIAAEDDAPAFGAACVEAAEVSEEDRWPRWVNDRLCVGPTHAPRGLYIAYVAERNDGVAWKIYRSAASFSPIAEGIETGDNATEAAMDRAEAELRARGILAPGVRVWR